MHLLPLLLILLPQQSPPYDLIIANGSVVDGSGAPARRADVAVRRGRIAAVGGPFAAGPSTRVIDASGLVVAPGFIDLHAHIEALPGLPAAENMLRQGVTTALGGPDGSGPLPVETYARRIARLRPGLNVATLVGHNTIRSRVMGRAQRAPTAAELARMRGMVAQAMREGAFGLSTGLAYVPGAYAATDEVVELAREAARRGGIYTSHMRDEASGVLASVAETIEIGRRAGIPVVITHHKVSGRPQWGMSEQTLALVDAARQAGVDVMLDQYPYTATQTGISYLVPAWALADGDSAFAHRATNPLLRDSIVRGIVHNIRAERGFETLEFVQFVTVPWRPDLQGRRLSDWAAERGVPNTPQGGAELIIEAVLSGTTRVVYHVLDEADVQRIMRHPLTMIASDGSLYRFGDSHPHPRSYGTFPRVLGRYVREERVLTLEDAVRRMTALPADRLGLLDRGRIAPEAWADLVLFDPTTIGSPATFEQPHQYPTGIPYVIVNGRIAVEQGAVAGGRFGVVIRKRQR